MHVFELIHRDEKDNERLEIYIFVMRLYQQKFFQQFHDQNIKHEKIQIKQKLQILLQKNLRIKLKHQILQIQRNQKLKRKLKNNHKGAVAGIIIATAP